MRAELHNIISRANLQRRNRTTDRDQAMRSSEPAFKSIAGTTKIKPNRASSADKFNRKHNIEHKVYRTLHVITVMYTLVSADASRRGVIGTLNLFVYQEYIILIVPV